MQSVLFRVVLGKCFNAKIEIKLDKFKRNHSIFLLQYRLLFKHCTIFFKLVIFFSFEPIGSNEKKITNLKKLILLKPPPPGPDPTSKYVIHPHGTEHVLLHRRSL